MKQVIFIEGTRDGYSTKQVEGYRGGTLTVEELIGLLQEYGEEAGMDAKVFIKNDNGYTYGGIRWNTVEIDTEEEGE